MYLQRHPLVGEWKTRTCLVRLSACLMAFLSVTCDPARCIAQLAVPAEMLMEGDEEAEVEGPAQPAFLLPTQPTEIAEAMQDFHRLAGRQQWEKAFKELEKVLNSEAKGLVPGDGGLMLPGRPIAQTALADLPQAGKDAYRLFYDPQAKKLLEEAQGANEREKLTQVVSTYLITSVGDVAADRLGDLEFEAGNFLDAIECWRSIVNRRPDSRLSKGRLLIKIGTALARENRWDDFRELQRMADKEQSDQKFMVGGREATLAHHLEQIAARSPAQSPEVQTERDVLPLGETLKLAWQFRLVPKVQRTGSGQDGEGLRIRDMYGRNLVSDVVFTSATDGLRLYVNYLGRELHFDLNSGKLLWRSGKFFELIAKASAGGFLVAEQYSVAADGNSVWSVSVDPSKLGTHEQPKFGLHARAADTGKDQLNSLMVNGLKEWNIRGVPVPRGDRVYVAASKEHTQELHVLAINAKDKKLIWSQSLGSYTSDPQQHYYRIGRSFQPSLLLDGARLFVDTHGGALVQLDVGNGQLHWGLNYESETFKTNRFWGGDMQVTRRTVSPPLLVNGVLYVKGMLSSRLYSVDPRRPRVLWKRPVPESAMLLGVDAERFYLGGEDIAAYDLKSRKLLWSVRVNLDTTYAEPLCTGQRIYHFGARGIYEIDKASGRVEKLFRGDDLNSLGGRLLVSSGKLLAISNLAISAYELEPEPAGKPTAAAAPSNTSNSGNN